LGYRCSRISFGSWLEKDEHVSRRNEGKPGYKQSNIDWIPSEWKTAKLGNLVSIRSGNSPAIFNPNSSGRYPFVKVDDMNMCSRVQNTAREYTDISIGIVPERSTIFAKRGAAIATNKVRITGKPLAMDSNMMGLIPKKDRIVPEFLFYSIQNEKLFRIADTSTIPQINNKHINPYAISLPPLPEQKINHRNTIDLGQRHRADAQADGSEKTPQESPDAAASFRQEAFGWI
jgi:type I restriction enzyme S subunit